MKLHVLSDRAAHWRSRAYAARLSPGLASRSSRRAATLVIAWESHGKGGGEHDQDESTRNARAGGRNISVRADSWRRRSFRAGERHADDRLQRQLAVVRPDDGSFGGQSHDPGDLSRDLRSICRAEPRSILRAWPADEMGLERGQDESLDGRARGRRLA